MSHSVGVEWILPASPSWSLVLCGVHTSVFVISWIGSGFSSDFGEFAFIFRISNFGFEFRSFLAYSVSIFLPKSWTITDCPALLVTHHFLAVSVEMMRNFISRVAPKCKKT